MAKDRLGDTFNYLRQRQQAGDLSPLTAGQVDDFEDLVGTQDKTHGGTAMSLGWSRFTNRPDEGARHALRAYLLASIYNGDITEVQAPIEAAQVKWTAVAQLHKEIVKRVRESLGEDHKAAEFTLHARGGGDQRAQAVCRWCRQRVQNEMETRFREAGKKGVAVVLIDMQATGDVGQNRLFGGKSILGHMKAVLKKASELEMVVYDIVIDLVGADEVLKIGDRKAVQLQAQQEYQKAARVQTITPLRKLFGNARVRHIPKPTHPTFAGTYFAKHLKNDGIDTVVVMGYDANQCIKATVFGVPEEIRWVDVEGVDPTAKQLGEWWTKHRPGQIFVQAEALQGLGARKQQQIDYVQGLLDHNVTVLTSRAVLASGGSGLENEWRKLAGL